MSSKYHQGNPSHPDTLLYFLGIVFQVQILGIRLRIAKPMTGMIIGVIIKTLEASFQEHKKDIQMASSIENIL